MMTYSKATLDTRKKVVGISLKVQHDLEGDDLLDNSREERGVGDKSNLLKALHLDWEPDCIALTASEYFA